LKILLPLSNDLTRTGKFGEFQAVFLITAFVFCPLASQLRSPQHFNRCAASQNNERRSALLTTIEGAV